MKKIRIMLLSLAVLAVVGGALAFKAKGTETACTTLAVPNGTGFICPAGITCPTSATYTTINPNIAVCTTPTNGALPGQDPCTFNDQGVVKSLLCGSPTTTVKID